MFLCAGFGTIHLGDELLAEINGGEGNGWWIDYVEFFNFLRKISWRLELDLGQKIVSTFSGHAVEKCYIGVFDRVNSPNHPSGSFAMEAFETHRLAIIRFGFFDLE